MLPSLDYKKIVLAILLVIISVGMLFGVIWLVFIRPGSEVAKPEGGGGAAVVPGGTLPEAGSGGTVGTVGHGGTLPGVGETPGTEVPSKTIGASEIASGSLTKVKGIIDDEVRDVFFQRGGLNYLSGEDDKFYKITNSGDKVALSQKSFPFVKDVTWSPDGRKVIIEYPDGANIVYDFSRDKQVTFPKGMEDPEFDDSSENVAYKFIGATKDDNWLVVSSVDNTKAKAVEPLGENGDKVQVSWSPTNQVVALYHKPIGLNKEEVFFIGQNQENYKSMVVEGSNFKGIWSPDGRRILYQVIDSDNNYNPVLWIVDATTDRIGANNFNLGLSTWVDKCVFDGNNNRYIYCAAPVDLPEGAGLYPDLLNNKPDVFYKIDLNIGVATLIAYPVSDEVDEFQVKKIFVDENSGKLYFWDGFTDKLYQMRLK